MARVYVSSTFKDLQDCRAKVRHVLRELDHIDVAMEYYVAEDKRPVDKCLQDVEGCDLYICLVAWRYGYIPEAQGYEQSITELEYRRAVDREKPVLAFMLHEDAPWPPSHVDRNRDQVEAFRETLAQNHLTAFFTGVEDLGARVNAAVVKWEKERGIAPAGGRTDWERYRQALIDRYRLVKLDAIAGPEVGRVKPIAITDIFVPQQTAADEAATELREPSLQILGRDPRQVILGGPGSGKTTLLQYAMLTLCDPTMPESKVPLGLRSRPVPFLIDLRSYTSKKDKGQVGDFVDYLVTQARDSYVEIEPGDLRAVLQQKDGALILFDGLDEVFKDGDRYQVADEIVAFARRYGGARIVVSSRGVGYSSEPLQSAGFTQYRLQPFGLAEIRRFLLDWYRRCTWDGDQTDAAELVGKITNNPQLRELAGNPLLLTMMAIISKRHELPETRWKLYEECADVLLERWDIKRKRIEHDEVFPLDFRMTGKQKAEILRLVARHMFERPEGRRELNAIRREPLLGIIADYLEKKRGKDPGEAEIIACEILDHLRERTAILVEVGADLFGFVHRSFMEYFVACDLLAVFSRGRADYEWLKVLYGTYWQQDEWREVLLLLIAMLSDREYPIREIVDHLHGQEVGEPSWNVVFAAWCLAEAGADDGPSERDVVKRLGDEILKLNGQTAPPAQFSVRSASAPRVLDARAYCPATGVLGREDHRVAATFAVAIWAA